VALQTKLVTILLYRAATPISLLYIQKHTSFILSGWIFLFIFPFMCSIKTRVEKTYKNFKKRWYFFSENFHFSVTLSKNRNAVKLLSLFECAFALLNVILWMELFLHTKIYLVSYISRLSWHAWLLYGKVSSLQANYYLFESDRRAVQFPRKTRSICRLERERNLISIEHTVSILSKSPYGKYQSNRAEIRTKSWKYKSVNYKRKGK